MHCPQTWKQRHTGPTSQKIPEVCLSPPLQQTSAPQSESPQVLRLHEYSCVWHDSYLWTTCREGGRHKEGAGWVLFICETAWFDTFNSKIWCQINCMCWVSYKYARAQYIIKQAWWTAWADHGADYPWWARLIKTATVYSMMRQTSKIMSQFHNNGQKSSMISEQACELVDEICGVCTQSAAGPDAIIRYDSPTKRLSAGSVAPCHSPRGLASTREIDGYRRLKKFPYKPGTPIWLLSRWNQQGLYLVRSQRWREMSDLLENQCTALRREYKCKWSFHSKARGWSCCWSRIREVNSFAFPHGQHQVGDRLGSSTRSSLHRSVACCELSSHENFTGVRRMGFQWSESCFTNLEISCHDSCQQPFLSRRAPQRRVFPSFLITIELATQTSAYWLNN